MILKSQYHIVLIYLLFGALWIFFSDMAVEYLFENKEQLIFAQNIKGWFFIIFTGLLLFVLITKEINKIKEVNTQLINSYEQTIEGWVHVMDLHNKETKDHTQRVTIMTIKFAKIYGITNKHELDIIGRGAILHDIGKIGISDAVLLKQGKLDKEEWSQIKMHPKIAHEIISHINFLNPSIDIPYYHHEKWDGSGYPTGLKGESIPIAARLFAVIDVWDALIHPRVYKSAWPEKKVLNYIEEESGKHFDPKVVKVFLENYEQIKGESDTTTFE
jgi:HD-GYP domain-containing protein (c-di-GMP phosphodiesterase class II)